MAEAKNVYQRLLEVQKTAKAPRAISGKFGKARSAEQILEAYKPVCNDNGLYLYTTDEMVQVGDRNYVTATATVVDTATQESHSASASAWENVVEKSHAGNPIMDTSQVTGKTSSYAKKYALQNLFAIDDTKDADQDEPPKAPEQPAQRDDAPKRPPGRISDKQLAYMQANFTTLGITEREAKHAYVIKVVGRDIESATDLSLAEAKKVIDKQLADIDDKGGEA